MDFIRIDQLAVYAHHGTSNQERELGQRFTIDVALGTNLTAAARDDDLGSTIDYAAVARLVIKSFSDPPCRLIEHAAWQVMSALFAAFPVERIIIRVRKPAAPVPGIFDSVSVELDRSRQDFGDG